MQLWDRFTFGQYKTLTLASVYQGTRDVSDSMMANFLNNCLKKSAVFFSEPYQFEFSHVLVSARHIEVVPQIFNEEKSYSADNVVYFGDISSELEAYFNYFFQINLNGTFEDLIKFNARTDREVIGGDPEYVEWCIRREIINLESDTKSELEKLQINRLLGVQVKNLALNKYSFAPLFQTEFFKFKTRSNSGQNDDQ